ncbi:MAG: SufE family protein [Flavobacteriales bacterium]
MNAILKIQNEIVEEFNMFEQWMEKYEHIIEIGKTLPLIEPEYKTDDNLINGCQSRVWLHANYNNGLIVFTADSDAIMTKGIVGLLIRTFSNQSPQDIIDADTDFINKIGLNEQLSPTRANGLSSMVKQMKIYAYAYLTK